jgi:hypothetical protein
LTSPLDKAEEIAERVGPVDTAILFVGAPAFRVCMRVGSRSWTASRPP